MPKAKIEPENNGTTLDPIIDALIDHLPAPGDYWSQDDRKLWLQMIELSFMLIYDDEPEPSEPGTGTATG